MAIYFGQALATRLTLADTYFGVNSHVQAYDWAKFSDDEKKAALVQAEREIDMFLGMELEDTYDTQSFPINGAPSFRPDYAVMEQAFFLLDNTARTATSSTGAKMIESDDYQVEERTTGTGIAPRAMQYLRLNTIQIERG